MDGINLMAHFPGETLTIRLVCLILMEVSVFTTPIVNLAPSCVILLVALNLKSGGFSGPDF